MLLLADFAQDQTPDALHHLLRQGVPYDQAWESVWEEWAFLTREADEPAPKPEDQPGVTRLPQNRSRVMALVKPIKPRSPLIASPTSP